MTQNFISILNAPAASSADIATSNGVITATGLSPYKANLVNACTVQRSLVESLQVWTVAMTAGVANTVSFSINQFVNDMASLRTFSFTQTASTTAANLLTQVNGFMGATATDGGAYVTASWGSIQYKAVTNSTVLTLTFKQVTGEAFPTVSSVSNTTVASGMSTYTLESQANVNLAAIVFKVTGHGLVTGNLIKVGTLTGQTAANNVVGRVIKVDDDTFNLANVQTNITYKASGTGTAVGTSQLTLVASPAFGTAALVNADAAANGSTQTATVTANNYSLVSINAGYTGEQLPTPQARVVPIHWWVSEDTNGLTLLSTIATSYLV
jgi:hypothetical protein